MNRTEKEEYIIGFISLISNKIVQFGNLMLTDITFPQWFLLMMISKMEQQEKTINSIAEFVGSSRQNVKKMLNLLAGKGYVLIEKSSSDKRALNVKLTPKTWQYFSDHDALATAEINKLFSAFSVDEIDHLSTALEKLLNAFEAYRMENENND